LSVASGNLDRIGAHKRLAPGSAETQEVGTMPEGDIETYFEDGQWKNKVEGGQRASNTAGTKAEAQNTGRDMARDRGVEHIVRKKERQIGERNTYPRSRDPRQSKG
jgi:hypothetical protein